MTTTATSPSTPGAVAPPPPRPRGRRTDTPSRMRVWSIVAAVAAALFGLIGSSVIANRTTELSRARDAAAQLSRLETVRTAVVEADSLAASSYLSGLESPERRATYEARLASAQSGLIDASANATIDESDRLGAVGSSLTTAAGLIEQARANSRQGFPVGAAYQRNASALIRSDILPVLDEIADATADRTADDVAGGLRAQGRLWLAAILALVVLVAASSWLARRTRRVVNVGLAIAGVSVLGFTAFGSAVMSSSNSSADDTINGSYAGATAYAQARTAAFDAKSNEALTLIARGNGAAFEEQWQSLATQSSQRLEEAQALGAPGSGEAVAAFDDYKAVHLTIREDDDRGNYAAAVAAALAVGTPLDEGADPSTADDPFAAFDTATQTGLDALATQTDTALDDASSSLSIHRWLILAAGLVAAAAAFAGFARRIQEYR